MVKAAIMAQLWPKIMLAVISGYIERIFLKLCSMLDHKKQTKITQVKFLEKSSFWQNGNYGPIVAQKYKLHKPSSQDWLCGTFLGYNKQTKIIHMKCCKESSLGGNGQFWPICGPKFCKLVSQDLF